MERYKKTSSLKLVFTTQAVKEQNINGLKTKAKSLIMLEEPQRKRLNAQAAQQI